MSSTWGFKSLYPHQQSQNPQFNSKHSLLCGSGSVVERCLAKADIAGPNPVSRSMPRYRKIARLFTSVIRTRVNCGNPRIPSPHPILAHDLLLQDSGAFSIRDSDPRGLREPPNPVSAMTCCCRAVGLFLSVIRTRVDRGDPRIPSLPMTCCCKTVRFLHP